MRHHGLRVSWGGASQGHGPNPRSHLLTDLPLPGLLRELVGITVTDWHALPPGVSYAVAYGKEAIPASIWAEALEPDPGTEELATYTAGPFGGAAALSCRPLSAGRALYLGWYPTLQQAELLVADLADRAAVDRLDPLLPEGVLRARRGRSTMLLNFTEQAQRVAVTRHGGPDVLRVVEADLPERRAREVRVNVLAPQFLPTISCSGAKVLPPARRACRSPQERRSLAWWAQVDTVNEAA